MALTEETFQFTAECQLGDADTLRVVNRDDTFVFHAQTAAAEEAPAAETFIHVSHDDAGRLARWLLFCLAEAKQSDGVTPRS
jgi:hypothetical protein